jgi:hypothetical protein
VEFKKYLTIIEEEMDDEEDWRDDTTPLARQLHNLSKMVGTYVERRKKEEDPFVMVSESGERRAREERRGGRRKRERERARASEREREKERKGERRERKGKERESEREVRLTKFFLAS